MLWANCADASADLSLSCLQMPAKEVRFHMTRLTIAMMVISLRNTMLKTHSNTHARTQEKTKYQNNKGNSNQLCS